MTLARVPRHSLQCFAHGGPSAAQRLSGCLPALGSDHRSIVSPPSQSFLHFSCSSPVLPPRPRASQALIYTFNECETHADAAICINVYCCLRNADKFSFSIFFLLVRRSARLRSVPFFFRDAVFAAFELLMVSVSFGRPLAFLMHFSLSASAALALGSPLHRFWARRLAFGARWRARPQMEMCQAIAARLGSASAATGRG